jgi:hypothetical protein
MRIRAILSALAGLSALVGLSAVVGLGLWAGPAHATPGFVVLTATHGFTVLGTIDNIPFTPPERRSSAAMLENAAFPTGGFAPPPAGLSSFDVPVFYVPPYCFHPRVIHLAPEPQRGRDLQVIYAAPPRNCPDE